MKKQQNNKKNVCKILTLSAVMLAFVFTTAGCRNVMLEQLLRNKKYDETTAPNKLVSLKINGVDLTAQIQAQMRFTYDDIGTPDGDFVIEAGISKDATISYDGAQTVKGTKNATVSAVEQGSTRTVIITVRPKSGSIKNYVILFQNQKSSAAKLTSFAFAASATLNTAFHQDTLTYTVSATVSTIRISTAPGAVKVSDGATVSYTLDGTTHTAGGNIDLEAGKTKVLFAKVKAASGNEAVYTFNILLPASTGAELTRFVFNTGATIAPTFDKAKYSYTVDATAASVTINTDQGQQPLYSDGASIIYTLDGADYNNTPPAINDLEAGKSKVLLVKVKAQSGAMNVYAFNILWKGSDTAKLTRFAFNAGPSIAPTFSEDKYSYTVNATTASVTIDTQSQKPTCSDGAAISYTLDGADYTTGTISLTEGVPRVLVVRVTSQSKTVSNFYTFYILYGEAKLTRVDFACADSNWTVNGDNNVNNWGADRNSFNIYTTSSSVTAGNIRVSAGSVKAYSTNGGNAWTTFTNDSTTINIPDLTVDGAAKTLLLRITPQPAVAPSSVYTFNIRRYKKEWVFTYKGAPESFTMPIPGTLQFELWGAKGGDGFGGTGGAGGHLIATKDVEAAPGEAPLYVYVGQKGNDRSSATGGAKAYGGGGKGNSNIDANSAGGGGGGATFISTVLGNGIQNFDGTLNTDVKNGRVLVAGGGGGASGSFNGGKGSGTENAEMGYGDSRTTSPTADGGSIGTGIGGDGEDGLNYGGAYRGSGGGGGGFKGGRSANDQWHTKSGGGGNGGVTASGYTAASGYTSGITTGSTADGNGKVIITVTPEDP